MLNELKHPEGGAVTGVLSITKIDGKTGEVTEYPMQYNHLTRWGLRAYNLGYRETPHRNGLVTGHQLGLLGLNRPIPPEDEVAAFRISDNDAVIAGMSRVASDSNMNIEPEKHGHAYKYAYTHLRDDTFELSVFSLGWYNSANVLPTNLPTSTNPIPSNAYWVPFNVMSVRDEEGRPSAITLNKGDRVNLTYRLIIKQDQTQQNTIQYRYKGREHTLTIISIPFTNNYSTTVYMPGRVTTRPGWFTYTAKEVALTPKHDVLPTNMMPYIPDNAEWRKQYVARFPADTFISDGVQKFEFIADDYLHTLVFDPPMPKGRGDVWEFSWILELHDRKTS